MIFPLQKRVGKNEKNIHKASYYELKKIADLYLLTHYLHLRKE